MFFDNAKTAAANGLNPNYVQGACSGGASREMTVGELLDQRIEKAERLVRALLDLKGSLPGNFLTSGASRISAFLEL